MSNTSPAQDQHSRPDFLVVLGLMPPVTVEDVKQAYLEKAKTTHPDRGGRADKFVELHKAFEQATEYARFKAGRMKWLTQWVGKYAEQEELIAEIQALGGSTEVEQADWLVTSVGNDFATVLERLVSVRLTGPQINDQVFTALAARKNALAAVQRVELIDTRITTRGLIELRHFGSLRHLDLSGTRVSPRTVRALLEELRQLESITLRNTGVGWFARLRLRMRHRKVTITA
jgi:aminopeptidase N